MIEVDCAINSNLWADEDYLVEISSRAVNSAFNRITFELPENSEVSLLFTDDQEVQKLNAQWRKQNKPTNVLSFAANDGTDILLPILGDIILAFETIKSETDGQKQSFDDHLTHLIVHGFLHLLGYDHMDDEEAKQMESLETLILKDIGIADPYWTN